MSIATLSLSRPLATALAITLLATAPLSAQLRRGGGEREVERDIAGRDRGDRDAAARAARGERGGAMGERGTVDRARVRAFGEAEKRAWLADRMSEMRPGAAREAEIRARLGRLGRRDLDRLVDAYFQQLAIAQANLLRGRNNFGYGYNPYRNAVGYAPVVTWLPTGTSLQAGGVISPDGRSVRVNAQPFFSSVPYYDTFILQNGQTRRFYVQGQPPQRQATPYRYHDGLRTHTKPPQLERYYDGLRTRYRPIER